MKVSEPAEASGYITEEEALAEFAKWGGVR